MDILFWTEGCTVFGDVIFYGTEAGLMGIEFSIASATKQMKIIQKEFFPQWELSENPRPILEHIAAAIDYIHGRAKKRPKLKFSGTPFQISVWHELMLIPVGETLSYSELATRIGKPTAARAVASAVAKNRFALVVPCHRVIQKDGRLGEYRWGAERKKRILQAELRQKTSQA
jgi:O-6-methylguanine DNA methyltransferase